MVRRPLTASKKVAEPDMVVRYWVEARREAKSWCACAGEARRRWVRASREREERLYTEAMEDRARTILEGEGVICGRSGQESFDASAVQIT